VWYPSRASSTQKKAENELAIDHLVDIGGQTLPGHRHALAIILHEAARPADWKTEG
jgi:hypothetical protein